MTSASLAEWSNLAVYSSMLVLIAALIAFAVSFAARGQRGPGIFHMRRRSPFQGSYYDEPFQSMGARLCPGFSGLAGRLRRGQLWRRCRSHDPSPCSGACACAKPCAVSLAKSCS